MPGRQNRLAGPPTQFLERSALGCEKPLDEVDGPYFPWAIAVI